MTSLLDAESAGPATQPLPPRRGVVLVAGLVGSLWLALGGLLLGHLALTSTALDLLAVQQRPPARAVGYALVAAGLVVLTAAWLVLGRQVRGTPDGVRRVVRTALVWALPLLVVPPLFSLDGWSYVADGVLTSHGLSPYVATPSLLGDTLRHAVAPHWRHTIAPYGPLPLLWGGQVARIDSDPWFVLAGYRLLGLIGMALLAMGLPRLARAVGRDPATATWLGLASPFLLLQGIGGLHLDLLLVGLVVVALAVASTGASPARHLRWIPAALLVGLALSVKASAVVAVVGVVLLSLPAGAGLMARVVRTVEVLLVSVLVVCGLGLLDGLGTGWVKALSGASANQRTLAVPYRLGLLASRLAHRPLMDEVSLAAVVLLALAVTVILLRGPTGPTPSALSVGGLALALSLLLSPVIHYWYFLWVLPVLACTPLSRGLTRAVVALTLVLGLLSPLDLSLHPTGGGPVVVVAVLAALATALLPSRVTGREPSQARHRA